MKEKNAFSEINERQISRALESGEQKPEKISERSKENKSELDKEKSLR